MAKPRIGSKLPILKVQEFTKILERNGFRPDEGKHSHIQYVNKEGNRVTALKGRKDIKSGLLKKIITEIAKKTNKTEKEVIEMLFNKKCKQENKNGEES